MKPLGQGTDLQI